MACNRRESYYSHFQNNNVGLQKLTFCRVAPETVETTSRTESHRPGTKPIQNTENKKTKSQARQPSPSKTLKIKKNKVKGQIPSHPKH